MRKLLFTVHLYSALVGGLFLVVVAATGSIIAFEGDLDRLSNRGLYTVQPKENATVSVSGILKAAANILPGQKIGIIGLQDRPEDPATVIVRGPRQLFIDSYTFRVLGDRSMSGPLNQIRKLHISLLLGPSGKTVVTTSPPLSSFLSFPAFIFGGRRRERR